MISILTGDIINSRQIADQKIWMEPLKKLLSEWGRTPAKWEIFRGDNFQLEISNPLDSLRASIRIKALIKSIDLDRTASRKSEMDIRIAIGIGNKDHPAKSISESYGSAFIFSGEKLEKMKKEKLTLAIKSEWDDFDREMNLYLKLAAIQMNTWSISSGELVNAVLKYPAKTQAEIGTLLGIEQNSVSGRYNRANVQEILEIENMFREKLKRYLS